MMHTASNETQGLIKALGLTDWWFSAFTERERVYIDGIFRPMGVSDHMLTQGERETDNSSARWLSEIAPWFMRPTDRHLGYKLLAKAEELANDAEILTRHFLYLHKIHMYYKDRNDLAAHDIAIAACKQQIALAPQAAVVLQQNLIGRGLPSHSGYHQLAVIREKQGDYAEAARLAHEALTQGWSGDWEKRIARCEKKAMKQAGNY